MEVVTGRTWDEALRERLIDPLGVRHTVTLPEEALLHRVALGHVDDEDGRPVPARVWGIPRSSGPAGTIASTVGDQLTFARMHLARGPNPMTEHVIALPAYPGYQFGTSWGLGWARDEWATVDGGRRLVIGHNGGTIGQASFLRAVPDDAGGGTAVVLLTNGGNAVELFRRVVGRVVDDLLGLAVPAPLEPPAAPMPVHPSRFTGTYAQASARLEITERDGGLVLRHTDTTPFAHLLPTSSWEHPLVPYDDGVFLVRRPNQTIWAPLSFVPTDDGPLVYLGGRAHTRIG